MLNEDSYIGVPLPEAFARAEAVLLAGRIVDLQLPLFPAEETCVSNAVDKRRREFCAGRTLARRALTIIGGPGCCVLPVGGDRVPCWPEGYTGSITHNTNFCACAVAAGCDIRAVGIDLESCGDVRPELWPQLFCRPETEWLQKQPAEIKRFYATVIFSAKEAFFKLQYRFTSAWLGFLDAIVSIESADRGEIKITPAKGTPAFAAVPSLQGFFCTPFPDTVLCQCWRS